MHPTKFLRLAGGLLILAAWIGWTWPALGMDTLQNTAHALLGILSLLASVLPVKAARQSAALIVSFAALFFGLAGLIVSYQPPPNFYGITQLGMTQCTVYLLLGLWGMMAAYGKE